MRYDTYLWLSEFNICTYLRQFKRLWEAIVDLKEHLCSFWDPQTINTQEKKYLLNNNCCWF